MKYKKLGPFIIQAHDHGLLVHTSRGLRKHLSKPHQISLWIAIMFMLGSLLFAIPSAFLLESILTINFINMLFFVGSIAFTLAAYLQYLEVINSDITVQAQINSDTKFWVWVQFRLYNLGFLSSFAQLIGALFFNINTFELFLDFSYFDRNNVLVWTPNMLGSLLFFLASLLAWLEVYHDRLKAFKSVTWWIIWINILGSVFFQISALYSYYFLSGDNAFFDLIAEWTTFLGAICFFTAAFLLRFETVNKLINTKVENTI
jgi:hypothetical protein